MMTFSSPERIYPESIEPASTNGWVLTTIGGEAIWAESTGGTGGGGSWPIDLSLSGAIFYYISGTPDTYGMYDGTGIVSSDGGTNWPDFSFSEIPALDPTHTYEITVTFDLGFGGFPNFWVWAMPSTDDTGYDAASFSSALYTDTVDLSSGTGTFQIGPGIEGWDTAVVADGNRYMIMESDRSARLLSVTINDLDATTTTGGSLGGVPVFLLELGQTVADFETLAGYSIPVPAIIARKDSSGGAIGWVPVFLLELGQTVSDYETLHSVTIPDPAIIARKTT